MSNGDVEWEDTGFGEVTSYTCDDGYTLEGDHVRVCTVSRTWSGDTPVCTCKYTKIIYK